jgi:hypothetical protein
MLWVMSKVLAVYISYQNTSINAVYVNMHVMLHHCHFLINNYAYMLQDLS